MDITLKHLKKAKKWQSLPKGWTDASVESFWDSLVGKAKHRVTKCMEKMKDKIDDPGSFCSSLKDKTEGTKWRSERRANASWKQDLFELFKQRGVVSSPMSWFKDARPLLEAIDNWDFADIQQSVSSFRPIDQAWARDRDFEDMQSYPKTLEAHVTLILDPISLDKKIIGSNKQSGKPFPVGIFRDYGYNAASILKTPLSMHLLDVNWWTANVIETDRFQRFWNEISPKVYGDLKTVKTPKITKVTGSTLGLGFNISAILEFKGEVL